jgi:glycosyltransferase involved in cell wall biosynthesis
VNVLVDARLPDASVGGVQVVIQCLALGFAKSRLEEKYEFNRFWLVYDHTSWWKSYIPGNDTVISVSFPFGKFGVFLLNRFPRFLSFLRPIYSMIFSFPKFPYDKILRNYRIDVVHKPFQDSFRTKFKNIWHPHDLQHMYFPHFFTRMQIRHRNNFWRKNAEEANIIICETPLIKKDLVDFWSIKDKKIEIVPTPPLPRVKSEIGEKDLSTPSNFLFYPAAFWPHKNHFRLIQAFDLLRKHGFDLSLVLTGAKTGVFKEVVKLIQELNQEDNVKILGHVSDDQMIHIFKSCRIVVIPTLHESLSLPIWEAWLYGKPVAYSAIGYLPSQVDGAGLSFDPFDITSIADSLKDILVDKTMTETFNKNAKKKLEILVPENFAKSCFEIYCRILNFKMSEEDRGSLSKLQSSVGYISDK